MKTLQEKADDLSNHIEQVENWTIILDGVEYSPPQLGNGKVFWDMHDNLIFGGRVEMYGFGRIYKRCILTSNKYQLDEIPVGLWHEVWTSFYDTVGEDASSPLDPVVEGNQVITVARWWPPDDYVKQLVEKRNFMTTKEFQVWADVIDDKHKEVGGKTPNYIKRQPFVSVN